jgi:hypothetical protein
VTQTKCHDWLSRSPNERARCFGIGEVIGTEPTQFSAVQTLPYCIRQRMSINLIRG